MTWLDVLSTEARAAVAAWAEPCEAVFEVIAAKHPKDLLRLCSAGVLRPGDLTFAAEVAGTIADSAAVRAALMPLLYHASPMVREGGCGDWSRKTRSTRSARSPRLSWRTWERHDRRLIDYAVRGEYGCDKRGGANVGRQLQIEVADDSDAVSFKRGELLRAVFVACWTRRKRALLDAGRSAADAASGAAGWRLRLPAALAQ